ncbi:cytochrome c3 family protein [Aromatoleum toluclasticum]|uniref:cytochrome c3 family protein n=1 Tax=Aromatoleum toluclasticum TaxID=92003 RepID=UPI001D17F9C6|nr:cytochrome c3 family protein [Aromatoleum toluclasticum]MCC4114276.1 cytochrome c3 family protein [Aromatoleum toluclasticum]
MRPIASCRLFTALSALLIVSALFGAPAVQAQRIDMRNSKHNLIQYDSSRNVDPRQICVFCHTPSDTNQDDAAQPKWQSSVPKDSTFLMFDDIGRIGTEGNEAVGSQSIACLSCHDSSQAFGVAGGSIDHPFAVPYRGALTPEQRKKIREDLQRAGKLINTAKQLKFDDGFRQATRGIIDKRPVWWVSKDTSSVQRGRLDVPLYVRIDAEDQMEIPFVECASCHDPHTVRPLFLRAENNPSELCLTCHIK